MKVDEALAKLAAEFGERNDDHEATTVREICSGGERAADVDPDEPPPGLYLTRELAIASWYRMVAEVLREQKPAHWHVVGGITVDKWRITVADSMNTQRMANDRFSVSARIGLVLIAPAPSET